MRPPEKRDPKRTKRTAKWFTNLCVAISKDIPVEPCGGSILDDMHLSPPSYNLSARNYYIVQKIYDKLKLDKGIDDVMFKTFLMSVWDIKDRDPENIFTLFDTDMGNSVDFDEFYLCVCILIANRDHKMAEFFAANSRTCFDLLDTESLGMITKYQGKQLSFLLEMDEMKISKEFDEFDTSHDQALDDEEFRRFTQRCIDQNRSDASDHLDFEWSDLSGNYGLDDTDTMEKLCGRLRGCFKKTWKWCRDRFVNWLTDPVTY